MEAQILNLFIVDDNKLMVVTLAQFLESRFGSSIIISPFSDGKSCLAAIDKDTHIVILEYQQYNRKGLKLLQSIKALNPKTEVIVLSSNEDIALAVASFRAGATDYVTEGTGAWKKIAKTVNRIITAPIRLLVREFGVSKYMAIFLLTFVTMGIVVASVLYALKVV